MYTVEDFRQFVVQHVNNGSCVDYVTLYEEAKKRFPGLKPKEVSDYLRHALNSLERRGEIYVISEGRERRVCRAPPLYAELVSALEVKKVSNLEDRRREGRIAVTLVRHGQLAALKRWIETESAVKIAVDSVEDLGMLLYSLWLMTTFREHCPNFGLERPQIEIYTTRETALTLLNAVPNFARFTVLLPGGRETAPRRVIACCGVGADRLLAEVLRVLETMEDETANERGERMVKTLEKVAGEIKQRFCSRRVGPVGPDPGAVCAAAGELASRLEDLALQVSRGEPLSPDIILLVAHAVNVHYLLRALESPDYMETLARKRPDLAKELKAFLERGGLVECVRMIAAGLGRLMREKELLREAGCLGAPVAISLFAFAGLPLEDRMTLFARFVRVYRLEKKEGKEG